MTAQTKPKAPSRWHRLAVRAVGLFSLGLIAGVLILWGWNTLAVQLFQAPLAQFKHAVAAEVLVASLVAICVAAARTFDHER